MLAVGNNPQSLAGTASLANRMMLPWSLVCNGAESVNNSFIHQISGWSRLGVFHVSGWFQSRVAPNRKTRNVKSRMNMRVIGGQLERSNSADSILRENTTSPLNGTMKRLQRKVAIVLFVHLFGRIKVQKNCFLSITATKPAKLAACFVRSATRISEFSKLIQRGRIALWPILQSEAR